MKKAETTARERLTGKPLIGFQTRIAQVRAPAIKVCVAEIKSGG